MGWMLHISHFCYRTICIHLFTLVLQLKNFKTAGSFARRLLELGPKPDLAVQVRTYVKLNPRNIVLQQDG